MSKSARKPPIQKSGGISPAGPPPQHQAAPPPAPSDVNRDTRIRTYPAWLVYEEDMGRLREYANLHRLGDSAAAIRYLLDEAGKR